MFLKKVLTRMFISQRESKAAGFKAAKDPLSLFCANAEGDFMVKPMLLSCSLNPHALKTKNKQVLTVHWRANRKAIRDLKMHSSINWKRYLVLFLLFICKHL